MDQTKEVTSFSQALLWFGAAVSIAEILTGVLLAPLGLVKGLLAIVTGHIIGCTILYYSGLIGAQSKLPAIESTRISFGKYGSYIFSVLNIVQLVGWTAVMILNGAKAFDVVTKSAFGFENQNLWSVLIAAFISIWLLVGVKNLDKINVVIVGGLFILSVILGYIVFFTKSPAAVQEMENISFGAAVELSVIMPLSWLPLISDYTKNVKNEKMGTLFSAGGYFLGSILMYSIGLGAALFAGTTDISTILIAAGLSVMALVIIVFSTVTTTFLDVYSAAVSFTNISKRYSEKLVSIIVCIIGLIIAVLVDSSLYESFLYLIGTAFAPLFAIVLTDYFILRKNKLNDDNMFNAVNSVIWVAGVIIYRQLMKVDTPIGSSLPTMIIISIICILINGGIKLCSRRS